ncbi:hypothetical protein L2E82_13078 [Cichorium intybus]|uniref:Uncharacterized protein n=1 Tax=Cichorium intybus TaxID=13427 RepID=A0ACB9GIV3_CICIN|nr:hypothetical protein L2E82_13078 [Cichorium intybus]
METSMPSLRKKSYGKIQSNIAFSQETVKELKKKTEQLKGVKEDLKVRTNQPTEQLYKHLESAWTETKATSEKVKETLGIGKPESTESSSSSANESSGIKDDEQPTDKEDKKQESGHASCVDGKGQNCIPGFLISHAAAWTAFWAFLLALIRITVCIGAC